ncbi:MAG: TetR/AcrR family transcriptional regulator [Terriglobia bacterium]|jgi:AcrR family transcriptional regulator
MGRQLQIPLEPRKTPVQARSTVTVEAIYEATFQVLLAMGGPNRLTTTRVAERAGVSVGTLYRYFSNKQSLLLSVLKKHHDHVASAVELACRRNHGQQVSTMIESVVEAFVDAKMKRSDISMALYATAVGAQERALVNKAVKRAQAAMASMLATAPNTKFADLPFTSLMLISAMGGATRAVLEAGCGPRMVRLLRRQLVLLCRGFLMSVTAEA